MLTKGQLEVLRDLVREKLAANDTDPEVRRILLSLRVELRAEVAAHDALREASTVVRWAVQDLDSGLAVQPNSTAHHMMKRLAR